MSTTEIYMRLAHIVEMANQPGDLTTVKLSSGREARIETRGQVEANDIVWDVQIPHHRGYKHTGRICRSPGEVKMFFAMQDKLTGERIREIQ